MVLCCVVNWNIFIFLIELFIVFINYMDYMNLENLWILKPVILVILSIVGLAYTFLPHSVHMKISPDWLLFDKGLAHSEHVLFGIVLLIIVLSIVLYSFIFQDPE